MGLPRLPVEEAEGYFLNGNPDDEEWPYGNEFDKIGHIELIKET